MYHEVFFKDILTIILEAYYEMIISGYLQVRNPQSGSRIEIFSVALGYFLLFLAVILAPAAVLRVMLKDKSSLE